MFWYIRESVYQLLSQTTPENTSKNYSLYSIDPGTRYPNVNVSSIKPVQVSIDFCFTNLMLHYRNVTMEFYMLLFQ